MSSSLSRSLNICCALVLALASSSTGAQESGAPLDLPPVVKETTPSTHVDTQEKQKRKSRAKTREAFAHDPDDDDDSAFDIEAYDGQRKPLGSSRTDDVDSDAPNASESAPASAPVNDASKGTMASTLIPGFIGLSLGAALPATILAAGVAGVVYASSLADADPNVETGMLGLIGLGCIGCGVLTIGPAGTIGSVAGAWIGATANNRSTRFAASGAAAGTLTLSLAMVSLAILTGMPRLSPWSFAIPAALFVLAAPISLVVATSFDVVTATFFQPSPESLKQAATPGSVALDVAALASTIRIAQRY